MANLPYETQFNYLLRLPYRSIMAYCLTSKPTLAICEDPYFWEQKGIVDYGIGTPSRLEYIEVDRIVREEDLLGAVKGRYLSLIPELLKTAPRIAAAALLAIDEGSLPSLQAILPALLRSSLTIGTLFDRAIERSQIEIARYLLPFLSDHVIEYRNIIKLYQNTLRRGDIPVVEFLLQYLETKPLDPLPPSFSTLRIHLDSLKYLINYYSGHPELPRGLSTALQIALYEYNLDVIDYLSTITEAPVEILNRLLRHHAQKQYFGSQYIAQENKETTILIIQKVLNLGATNLEEALSVARDPEIRQVLLSNQ